MEIPRIKTINCKIMLENDFFNIYTVNCKGYIFSNVQIFPLRGPFEHNFYPLFQSSFSNHFLTQFLNKWGNVKNTICLKRNLLNCCMLWLNFRFSVSLLFKSVSLSKEQYLRIINKKENWCWLSFIRFKFIWLVFAFYKSNILFNNEEY